jgi:hypothetical protein
MTWRAPTADDRRIAWLWATCAALAIAMRPFWMAMAPLLPACPFHRITGVACPGCGTTRAVLALLRLDFAAGLAVNPLAFLAAATFLAAGLLAPAWVAWIGRVPVPSPGPKWGWGIAAAAGLSINWAWLVATGI